MVLTVAGCASAPAEWPQWGGPNRDFLVRSTGLASSWPVDGPRRIWHRELGDGYSTILGDNGMLYTMYRTGADEFTVALDADSGATIWQHKQPSPTTPLMDEYGAGPHTTPLIAGDRLFTVGTNAVMHGYDKGSGRVLWKHDLAAEYNAPIPGRGYGASPIAYGNTIIVPVDRKRDRNQDESDEGDGEKKTEETTEGQSLIAFDQATGEVVWKSQDDRVTYASPILINFEGQDQLVLLMAEAVMGVNPLTGELLWHTQITPSGANLSTPVWNGKDLLFCSSAYDSGSRVMQLIKKDGETVPKQLWYTRKMRMHHGNAVQLGDYLYGSSGDFGPAFFTALNLTTGKPAWRERGFRKSNCVYADGKLIILDEDGKLALTTISPEGLKVLSECTVAERYAWAAPTLVGTTLYVRDRMHIMALDLG
jgi:outer membrane protein assembly factor BamB